MALFPKVSHRGAAASALVLLLCSASLWAPRATAGDAMTGDAMTGDRAAANESATRTTTIFLVRHAEKVRGPEVGRDPELTEAGHARARALAHTLSDAGIDVITTTQWRRTSQTAAPLADLLGLEPKVVRTDEPRFIERMVELVEAHRGRTLVVVGHSDTTPDLARALGATTAPDISDDDFDDLYQVQLGDGSPRFIHLRFGHPTP